MYHIRIILIMLLVALIGTASAAAALSTLSLERTIEVGFTNDSSQTAGIRIENTSEYDFMTEDEDGVVSFDLSKIITEEGNFDFNKQAEYTLANTDGSDVFVITNNTNIPVYIGLIEENISGLVIVGSEQILPGMASGYHFRLSTASDGIGLYDFLTAKLMISSEEIIDGNVLMGSNNFISFDSTPTFLSLYSDLLTLDTVITIDQEGGTYYSHTGVSDIYLVVSDLYGVKAGDGDDFVFDSDFGNRIEGSLGADILFGYGGDDLLMGYNSYERDAGEDDILIGGAGNDGYYLYGGSDTIVLTNDGYGYADYAQGFAFGVDKIDISELVYHLDLVGTNEEIAVELTKVVGITKPESKSPVLTFTYNDDIQTLGFTNDTMATMINDTYYGQMTIVELLTEMLENGTLLIDTFE